MSRDIPVIMSAPMVRATWSGHKTMTRRLLYTKRTAKNGIIPASATILQGHPPPRGPLSAEGWPTDIAPDQYWTLSAWQRVKPGDRLWVRENWSARRDYGICRPIEMKPHDVWRWADGNPDRSDWTKPLPSIHMPRWASRLTLIVTATKIERLQAIREEDVIAEGCCVDSADGLDVWYIPGSGMTPHKATGRECFEWLWTRLHGTASWDANPDVVAIAFRVVKANIDTLEASAA